MTPTKPEPADWAAVRALFDQLLALPADQRAAALAASGASAEVQAEVQSLLAHVADSTESYLAAAVTGPLMPPTSAASDRSGQRLGPWQLVAPLGAGGMGEVYSARRADGAYDSEVAVKLLKRGLDSDAVLARFAQEQRTLARLNHPHIAHLLDAGRSDDGLPYFVMELVDGQHLDQACSGRSLEQRLDLFLQLADAVAHAHRSLLVHRDLKPSNVLVTADGQVKLLDFGIAKALDPAASGGDAADVTGAGQRLYTPHYASPEQVRGEPVGTATDVYSLGVLLYVMLTGVRPYGRDATTPLAAARSVLEETPSRPSTLSPGLVADPRWLANRKRLAGDLDNILLKALDKRVGQRYPSVDALAADIQAYLGGWPVSARAAGWGYRAAKFVGRNRLLVGVAALGLAGLVAGLATTAWQWQQAEQARRTAEAQRALAQQRFVQVRQLANQLVFKYHDQVENLPGATKVREALLTDAAAFLDGLSQAAGDDLGLAEELAGTYYRIGRLQGVDQSINTGQHAQAEANLAKAIALTRRYSARNDASTPALANAVNMHISQGELWQRRGRLAQADAALREGLPLLDRALARDGKDTWALASAISLHGVHARILGNTLAHASLGRWRDACTSADKARAAADTTLAADPANIYAPDSLAFTLGEQASCRLLAGQAAEAQALHEQQVTLRDQMAQKMPDDMDFRYQRGVARAGLAMALSAQGQHAAALDRLAEALAITHDAVATDAGNAGGQRRLRLLAVNQLQAQVAAGDADSARRSADRLLAELPAVPAGAAFADLHLRALALVTAARAWRTADAARARSLGEQAAALLQPPSAADDNATRRWLLAQALGEVAAAQAADGQPAAAAETARQAVKTWGLNAAEAVPPLLLPRLAEARVLAGGP